MISKYYNGKNLSKCLESYVSLFTYDSDNPNLEKFSQKEIFNNYSHGTLLLVNEKINSNVIVQYNLTKLANLIENDLYKMAMNINETPQNKLYSIFLILDYDRFSLILFISSVIIQSSIFFSRLYLNCSISSKSDIS